MIQSYYDSLVGRLERVRPLNTSCHVPGPMLEFVERELLMDRDYVAQTPPGYPKDEAERNELRRIRQPFNAWYRDVRLRVGMTTLHLRHRSSQECLETVMLVRMTDAELAPIDEVRAFSAKDMGAVFLHENGIVATEYLHPQSLFVLVDSFYPHGATMHRKHPRSADEAERHMHTLFSRGLTQYGETGKDLSRMLMLAVEAYRG